MLFKRAILIIHGFAGGTYDEEELANYLELNKGFDVFQYTLPGHDKNLSKVQYKEWIEYSENQVNWLIDNGYSKIYLIGHSMGGVIATYLASKYNQVKKLVLAAPAFHYLDVKNNQVNIAGSLKKTPKLIKDYGTDEIIARMLKLNLGVVKEFMNLVREYYYCTKDVTCKTLILQGKKDILVPTSSSEYVYKSINTNDKKIVLLDDTTHDIFRSEKRKEIFKIVEEFLKGWSDL